MKFAKFYIVGSIVIGFLQVLDGLTLMLGGKLTSFSTVVSVLEFLWVPLSIWAAIVFSKISLPKFPAISYILYNIAGWSLSLYLFMPEIKSGTEPKIPLEYALAGACFGAYFLTVNFLHFKNMATKNA